MERGKNACVVSSEPKAGQSFAAWVPQARDELQGGAVGTAHPRDSSRGGKCPHQPHQTLTLGFCLPSKSPNSLFQYNEILK